MNKVDVSIVKEEPIGTKSDLRRTKTELFNKLIGNQSSQQMIVTTPSTNNNNDTSHATENLERCKSLAETKKSIGTNQTNQNTQMKQNDPQKGSKSSNNQSLLQQQAQLLLPEELRKEPVSFSGIRSRWYTNEEVASILTNFDHHSEWLTDELQIRPKSGAVLLYSREKVRYRQDGYCWKKRKNGRTTREDHMKLKVQGVECIYGCYVHSAILPTFHRRCYWLLQNPDIVLVHYLNQPPDDQNKMMITFNSALLEADTRRSWTNEEIIEEIGSVFGGISQIHHTLNINFPPLSSLAQDQLQCQASANIDKMIESSPQSEQSQATSNSELNQEQVDMTILETQRQQHSDNSSPNERDLRIDLDGDELMSVGHDSSGDQTLNGSATSDNPIQDGKNQPIRQQQQHPKQDGSIKMMFDVMVDNHNQIAQHSNINNETCRHEVLNCFGFSDSNILTTNNVNIDSRINNRTVNNSGTSTDVNGLSMGEQIEQQHQLDRQVDENPCSPVTQIYNKIVDDIETYVLPLETDQFNSRHHHHHHGVSMASLPIEQISGETCQQHNRVDGSDHHQQQHLQEQQHHHQSTQVQFSDLTNETRSDADKEPSGCSMDLVTCDLFAENSQQSIQVGGQQVKDDDTLLLSEFNVGQVGANELDSNVVDTLTNDDLRDLMMGMPTNGNANQGSLLVDTNSLDLFNFKPSTWDQRRQQLDVKSTTSDSDALSRLSPMDQVPRCNSTGNTMLQTSDQIQNQQHHFSNNNFFLCQRQDGTNIGSNHFDNGQDQRRSVSTNPSGSTSCSLSPSSSSLRAGINIQSRPSFVNPNSTINSTAPSFMRLPLQQRQKSEQKEPCTTVLGSLLPKAVSLDGSDLSTSNCQMLHTSPVMAYGGTVNQVEQIQSNLLLIPSNQQQQPKLRQNIPQHIDDGSNYSAAGHYNKSAQQMSSSLSPTNPYNNSGEILINPSGNYKGMHYGSSTQIEPTVTNQGEYDAQKHPNILLPILDYVPNWCNITGGAKVIIVGNWSSMIPKNSALFDEQSGRKLSNCDDNESNGFFALFDNLLVPATLIQDNILRCFAPSHEPGFITLKVLYKNRVVSEQVLFEMRPSCVQSINQLVNIQPRDNSNQSGGQDSFTDGSNNQGNMGMGQSSQYQLNQQQPHRNSTSSNHSTTSSAFANQISQTSSSSSGQSVENSKVLTMAENIISAMHRKNNIYRNHGTADYRLVNSLDMESSDNYLQMQQNSYRQQSFKNGSRRMGGSRSLSRDSEPASTGYGFNLGFMDNDPYWHKGPIVGDTEQLQPLTVMTDFITNNQRPNNIVFNQKRHSSGSAGLLAHYHSAFPYHSRQVSGSQVCAGLFNNVPMSTTGVPAEWQSAPTEASSSGLGSVVSSLSPSNSSLHSPSSACATSNNRDTFNIVSVADNQSPCSCGRQSLTTPTSADFCEYFQASAKTEESFASLTLNDSEQKELYEAAKIIQKAYRTYRGRKRQASELLVDVSNSDINCDNQLTPSGFSTAQNHTFQQQQQQQQSSLKHSLERQQVVGSEQKLVGSTISRQPNYYVSEHQMGNQQTQQPILVKCYRDREMQAATIIQAYYRRYRQYVHYKRQQANSNGNNSAGNVHLQIQQQSHSQYSNHQGNSLQANQATLISNSTNERRALQGNARLVVDTMSIKIDKATTTHVDRKRFKTAMLMSSSSVGNSNGVMVGDNCTQRQQPIS